MHLLTRLLSPALWRLAGPASVLAAGAAYYATQVEPHAIEYHPVTLILPHLDPAFDGFTLVQLSDLHVNGWMTPARLAAVAETVNALQPDVIALTGDFISSRQSYDRAALIDALRAFHARELSVAVLGNHDHGHHSGPGDIRAMLHAAGIVELENRVHTLRRGSASLHLAGVDDLRFRRARLDRVLTALPAEGAAILLAHEPDFADISAATGRFDLQLSGHTHGGQVRAPLIGPLLLPRHGQRYPAGLYRANGMYLYTNRGLGMGHFRVRFNCRPEVTIFTLLAPDAHER
ncbi:MAG: metallophosphoesterase [Anaerolineae bacterium]|nr:metallophosphoesterase [Anaerolineae bacterium]